jgi:hypothetical protein
MALGPPALSVIGESLARRRRDLISRVLTQTIDCEEARRGQPYLG